MSTACAEERAVTRVAPGGDSTSRNSVRDRTDPVSRVTGIHLFGSGSFSE